MRLSGIPRGPLGERLNRSFACDRRPCRTKPTCGKASKVGGWTETRPVSLGLLPSGPDPVGEWCVHRQPPSIYIWTARANFATILIPEPSRRRQVRRVAPWHKGSDESCEAHAAALRLKRIEPWRERNPCGSKSIAQTGFHRRTILDERPEHVRQQRQRFPLDPVAGFARCRLTGAKNRIYKVEAV
jgi:hypothetical protein